MLILDARRAVTALVIPVVLSTTVVVSAASAQATATTAPGSTAASDSAEVAATVQRYHDALGRGDSIAAIALLAPSAVILETGALETVAEYRAHHLASDIEFARAVPEKRSTIHVTVRDDAAWAASTTVNQGTFRGRTVDSTGAELMVLTRTQEGWRIAAIHWSSRRRN